jgi:integrase
VLSELVSFGLWLQKQGYRNSTVQSNVKALKALAKRTDLLDSESVKEHLALAQLSEGRKQILAQYLERFYRFKGIAFEKTRYRRVERLPFVPTEVEIDQLISAVGRKMSAFLLLLKETGTRAGEAWNLKWTDVDSERNCVTVPPEKNSNPRQLKITARLFAALNNLPHVSAYIFRNPDIDASRSLDDFRRNFEDNRKRIAEKLQNPRIRQISFKTMRHWKATVEYHRTKDILHVMRLLGHKNIKNTLVYTHLVDFGGDEYVCKVARGVDEAKGLVEDGFEYVTDMEAMKLFRKRK